MNISLCEWRGGGGGDFIFFGMNDISDCDMILYIYMINIEYFIMIFFYSLVLLF